MKEQITSQLYNRNKSMEFYEDRYKKGYMDEWPIEKKRIIIGVIQDIQLPDKGDALDFGCGNGVLTEVLRQALPSWSVYGMDMSKTAVGNAKNRYPNCTYFEPNEAEFKQMKFDFVFTHHIFEHVFDINKVFNQMESYLKPNSSMLHFLPCGNEDSYEHKVCLLRKDGINAELGNRFFFEDEGHVRRLTSKEFIELSKTKGFELKKEYYLNQYYGAIDWITTQRTEFVRMFTDSTKAIDSDARKKLNRIRRRLMLITMIRRLSVRYESRLNKKNKKLKHYISLLMGLPLYVFARSTDRYCKKKSREEWETQKFKSNGSEMGLNFKRE